MPLTPELQQKLKRLPHKPGVYLMHDRRGAVIYIGKATDLRDRVRSYFSGTDPRTFVQHLDDILHDVEVVITQNAKEAQLLENTLIKKHKPRFNIMLRDDKNYLSLRIDTSHPWPRVEVVRRMNRDGAHYFGPYHSAASARQTLRVLNQHFQLRTCRDSVLYNRSRPCLQYQIKRCPAPCVLELDRDAYMADVKAAMMFLGGRNDELVQMLEQRMVTAAEELAFEHAAQLRDQIDAIRRSLTRQQAVTSNMVDRDVIALHRDAETVAVSVLHIRNGVMVDVRNFAFEGQIFPDELVIEDFVSQFYALDSTEPPAEVVLGAEPPDLETLEQLLSDRRGRKVEIVTPRRGDRVKLLGTAVENARNHLAERLVTADKSSAVTERLQQKLHLEKPPVVIECYDISNFQGKQVVASQVTFVEGRPARDRYKRYRIRTVSGQDDFASMFEVLGRRARRAREGGDPMPDLIVIDGGKGQLGMAVAALHDLGMREQDIVSLAKSRVTGLDEQTDAAEHSPERVFRPGQKNPIVLRQNSEELHLLARIRDEAHRFAITFHRELRSRETLRSQLDVIPGVGRERVRALLRQFGSVRRVRQATLAELEAVQGLPRNVAWSIFNTFHPGESDPPPS
jgi:excinuclease ABC subunit C